MVILVMVISACNPAAKPSATVVPTATVSLPTPNVSIASAPDVETVSQAYLDLWVIEDYPAMYEQLSRLTKDAITVEDFEARHRNTAIKLTMQGMDYQILSSMLGMDAAQVSYQLDYETALLGTITRQSIMHLILEDGSWHIQWADNMMLPELINGNYLELVIQTPARGNIYSSDASNNYPLVAFEDAVTLMVTP